VLINPFCKPLADVAPKPPGGPKSGRNRIIAPFLVPLLWSQIGLSSHDQVAVAQDERPIGPVKETAQIDL
jgi:hypothetical protein